MEGQSYDSIDIPINLAGLSTSGMGVIASRIPAAFYELQRNAKTDWNYRTVPQEGCNGREMHWTRTRLLGGCSSGNAMMHHRGAPEDFDEWAALQRGKNGEGEAEWRFSEFQKSVTLSDPWFRA